MSVSIYGHWRLTIISQEAGVRQFRITGSSNADGTYSGNVGTAVDVQAVGEQPWELTIENFAGGNWNQSGIRLAGPVGVVGGTDLLQTIGSEDNPASTEPIWDDIVLQARNLDPLIRIPIRPFAMQTDDLQMMPDGIFDTALGEYYMGVRVENTWGTNFSADSQWIGITPASRAALAASGIQIVDAWTQQELESLGQKLNAGGNHVVLPALDRRTSHTIYFKVDCTRASPGKYTVEFECVEASMVDPGSPRRRATAKIFVSRSILDTTTGRINVECPEGRLSLKITRFAAPVAYILRERKRISGRHHPGKECSDVIKKLREVLSSCQEVDCRDLRRILDCHCEDRGSGHCVGRYCYPDFPIWPTEFEYVVEGKPYTGTTGPIPFQDPWWKLLLILAAILLGDAAEASAASDVAYHDKDLLIGTLERWQQNDVDAAVAKLDGRRSIPSPDPTEVLDAHSDETVTTPIQTLDGNVDIDPNFLSKAEVDAAISAQDDSAKIFKSGARSGTTHGIMHAWAAPYTRPDDNTRFNLPQIIIWKDPALNQVTSQHGDSGSVWVQTSSKRLVALNHSGSTDDSGTEARASLLADVASALNIKFTPT